MEARHGQPFLGQPFCLFSSFFAEFLGHCGRSDVARWGGTSRGCMARAQHDSFVHRTNGKPVLELRGSICLRATEGTSDSAYRPRSPTGNAAVLFSDNLD